MATIEELVVRLEADNAKLITALEESAKVTARSAKVMEDSIAKMSEESGKKTSKLDQIMTVFAGTTMANLATSAFNAVSNVAGQFVQKLGEGITEAADFEKEMNKLANSLAMSGNFSQKAVQGLSNYISKMEELTGVDDAVIAGNLSVLSSLTKLNAEGLQRANTAAQNLSAATGIDLTTAIKMVGKAANGETDAFKKVGISIQETGDKASTLSNTLSVLETRFGGAASASMKTFAGSMLAAQNAVGNLFQSLGDVVVSNPAVIAAIQEVTNILKGMQSAVDGNADSLKKNFADVLTTTINGVAAVVGVVEDLVKVFVVGYKTVATFVQGIADLAETFVIAQTTGASFGDVAKTAFKESSGQLDGLVESATSSGNSISEAIYKIGDASGTATAFMKAGFDGSTPAIKNQAKAVAELTLEVRTQLDTYAELGKSLATAGAMQDEQRKRNMDALTADFENQKITAEQFNADMLTAQQATFAAQQQGLIDSRNAGKLTNEEYYLAERELNAKQAAEKKKLEEDNAKREEAQKKQRLQDFSTFFGNLAALQQSSSKELAAIGKAAAIAQATINMYEAITGAYKTGANIGGPVLGAAFGAAAGAAQAANLAKIAGVGLAGGIDSVPGVGSRDNFPAVLAPGERVVPSETNQDLTAFLARQQENQGMTVTMNFNGLVAGNPSEIGAQIVEYMNEAFARGSSVKLIGAI